MYMIERHANYVVLRCIYAVLKKNGVGVENIDTVREQRTLPDILSMGRRRDGDGSHHNRMRGKF